MVPPGLPLMLDRIPATIAFGHGREEVDWLRTSTERGGSASAKAIEHTKCASKQEIIPASKALRRRSIQACLVPRSQIIGILCGPSHLSRRVACLSPRDKSFAHYSIVLIAPFPERGWEL